MINSERRKHQGVQVLMNVQPAGRSRIRARKASWWPSSGQGFRPFPPWPTPSRLSLGLALPWLAGHACNHLPLDALYARADVECHSGR